MVYLEWSRAFPTSSEEARSTLRIVAPSARDKPVPLAVQSRLAKAFKTCRPSRPVAPVISAVLSAMLVQIVWIRPTVSKYEFVVLLKTERGRGAVMSSLLQHKQRVPFLLPRLPSTHFIRAGHTTS